MPSARDNVMVTGRIYFREEVVEVAEDEMMAQARRIANECGGKVTSLSKSVPAALESSGLNCLAARLQVPRENAAAARAQLATLVDSIAARYGGVHPEVYASRDQLMTASEATALLEASPLVLDNQEIYDPDLFWLLRDGQAN
jgi:hypothetical protein